MKNKNTLTKQEQKALKAILLDNLIEALTNNRCPMQAVLDISRLYDLSAFENENLYKAFN